MRVKLSDLLAERAVIHPTRIAAVRWTGDELCIAVRGYPWWEPPSSERLSEGVVHLIFGGLGEGAIRPDEFNVTDDEALEDFELKPVADVAWAQPSDWSIYCSEPIQDPLQLYVRLHDFLSSQGAFKTPGDFLNQAEHLAAFVEMARSPGFLLGKAPERIRLLLCDELQRQGVRHNVVRTIADTAPAYLVRLGLSAFLCSTAEADFVPAP